MEADILVSHEAPKPHPNGWLALNALARSLRVRQVFHGHHHDNLDYAPHWNRLGFEVHGVGLRGISDRKGKVIVAGEIDDILRRYRPLPRQVSCGEAAPESALASKASSVHLGD